MGSLDSCAFYKMQANAPLAHRDGLPGGAGDGAMATSGTSLESSLYAQPAALLSAMSERQRHVYLCQDLIGTNTYQGVVEVAMKPGRDITLMQLAPTVFEFRATNRCSSSGNSTGLRAPSSSSANRIVATFQSHQGAWDYLQTLATDVSILMPGKEKQTCTTLPPHC